MRTADLYTKAVLTVIAGLLAWNTVVWVGIPSAHAQAASPRYSVEVITADLTSKQYQTFLATAINGAAKGRELVTVVPFDQGGRYFAVYQEQAR